MTAVHSATLLDMGCHPYTANRPPPLLQYQHGREGIERDGQGKNDGWRESDKAGGPSCQSPQHMSGIHAHVNRIWAGLQLGVGLDELELVEVVSGGG